MITVMSSAPVVAEIVKPSGAEAVTVAVCELGPAAVLVESVGAEVVIVYESLVPVAEPVSGD